MAARSPRKTFANPFVVTLAAIPACFTESSPPPAQQPTQPQPVESRPTQPPTTPTEVVVTNPPRPQPTDPATPAPTGSGGAPAPGSPPKPDTAPYDQFWSVFKNQDGKCSAMARVECPKPKKAGDPVPTCNPPPPMKIECPSAWDGKVALTVVKYANQSECEIERAPMKCPPNTKCNPPPPRKVACPTWK